VSRQPFTSPWYAITCPTQHPQSQTQSKRRGGHSPPNSTTTTIPQSPPSYNLTPLGHTITNQNKLHCTGINPSQFPPRHKHRHCRPTRLLTNISYQTTNYPPRRENIKEFNIPTQLNKIRGHANIGGNDLADKAAKLAVISFEDIPEHQKLTVTIGKIAERPPFWAMYTHNPNIPPISLATGPHSATLRPPW
jgi:hypothetical protein